MRPETQPNSATILIIDDEPIQLRAIVAELDILMPGWDGYETCRRLEACAATAAVPVIFLSALCDTAQKLAHRIGTNQVRLGRAFQTHLGMSPFEYLREQRLVRAQGLLTTGDQQMQQIAESIGFKRAGDFATAFRLRFGMTPREYRRRHG